jgi:hypothetical protein
MEVFNLLNCTVKYALSTSLLLSCVRFPKLNLCPGSGVIYILTTFYTEPLFGICIVNLTP